MFENLWTFDKSNYRQETLPPYDQLRKDLLDYGDFKRELDGSVKFEDFLVLQSIIRRQFLREF